MADLWAQSRQNQQAQDAIQPPPPFVMPPMSSPPPLVFAQPAQGGRLQTPQEQNISADTKALQKVRWNESHPWGTAPTYDANGVQTDPGNHPGTLGKIGHAFATLGNIAGDIFAPAVTANIPGSQLNMQMKEGDLVKRLNTDVGAKSTNDYRDAETAKTQEDMAEAPRKAQDTHDESEDMQSNLESQTKDRDNPAFQHIETDQGIFALNPRTNELIPLTYQGKPLQKPTVPKGSEHINIVGPNGKPMVGNYDPTTRQTTDSDGNVIHNPQPYEKPTTINNNAADAGVDRLAARLGKPYQTGFDKASDQFDKVDEAQRMLAAPGAEGKALALPKVLTALVSGQGSGVRITQPELNAIATARGVKGSVEAFFNSISGEGKLSADQISQLNGILKDVRVRLQDKAAIHSQALDAINGANDRGTIQRADKQARQLLNDYEHAKQFGTMADGTRTRSNDGEHWFNILNGQEVK